MACRNVALYYCTFIVKIVGARGNGVVVSGEGVVVVFGGEERVGIGFDSGGFLEEGLVKKL
jgi:hypothetical protein